MQAQYLVELKYSDLSGLRQIKINCCKTGDIDEILDYIDKFKNSVEEVYSTSLEGVQYPDKRKDY